MCRAERPTATACDAGGLWWLGETAALDEKQRFAWKATLSDGARYCVGDVGGGLRGLCSRSLSHVSYVERRGETLSAFVLTLGHSFVPRSSGGKG
jgi:hypothetical protein